MTRTGARQRSRLASLAACAAIAGFFFSPTGGPAQQPTAGSAVVDTPVVVLPPLRIEVSRLGAGGIPLERAPFGAQVIAADALRQGAPLTVADVTLRLPGVSFADVMGSSAQPDLMIRGFGVSPVMGLPQGLSVFVDGVRINEPDANQVNFDLVPLQAIERIEVLRGPSGPFGRNTLGGAINIVTRRGSSGREGWFDIVGGSDDQLEGRAQVSGPLGAVDYQLAARYHRSEGWRQDASTRLRNVFMKLGHRGDRSDVWLSYTGASDSLLQAGSLPRSWLDDPSTVPQRYRNGVRDTRRINFTGGDAFAPRLHFVAAGGEHRLSASTAIRGNLFHRRHDARQFNANFIEPDIRIASSIRSSGGALQLAHSLSRLTVITGAEYTMNLVDLDIFEHPNENHPQIPASGTQTEDVGTREHNLGAFTQARFAWTPRVALTGALRFDYVSLPFDDRLEPGNSGRNVFRQLTGTLGADAVVAPGVVLIGSYGRGFRAPVIMELACADPDDPCPLPYELGADPPLAPVTTDTWQAGVRFTGPGRFRAELIGYWAEVHNDIFFVQPPETRAGHFENIRRTRRQGLELATDYRLHPALTLRANAALTRATFRTTAALWAAYLDDDDDEAEDFDPDLDGPVARPGDEFPMVPRARLGAGIEYAAGRWRAGAQAGHTSRQWLRGDEGNEHRAQRLSSYTIVDLRVERAYGRLSVYAMIDNVFDTRHETFGVLALNRLTDPAHPHVEPFVTPGSPRRVLAGMRLRAW